MSTFLNWSILLSSELNLIFRSFFGSLTLFCFLCQMNTQLKMILLLMYIVYQSEDFKEIESYFARNIFNHIW